VIIVQGSDDDMLTMEEKKFKGFFTIHEDYQSVDDVSHADVEDYVTRFVARFFETYKTRSKKPTKYRSSLHFYEPVM